MTVFLPPQSETDLKKIVLSIQQLGAGRSNGVGTVTCSTAATTTVTDGNCSAGTKVQLTASTSNAAAAYTSTWVSSTGVLNGSFVVSHTIAATTDRTFNYAVLG